jgi:hypothetical protein
MSNRLRSFGADNSRQPGGAPGQRTAPVTDARGVLVGYLSSLVDWCERSLNRRMGPPYYREGLLDARSAPVD